ncbi:MAG: tetratricopeptide repeat protein [Acidobacteria bacterium]|nr:tetratricopeptide repeat protein [Acidobacteriota bacterium]
MLVALTLGCGNVFARSQASLSSTAAAFVRAGQYDAAVAEAKRGLQAHPNDPGLHTVEGIALSMQGKDADAIAAFRAALRISPDFLPALRGESQVLSRDKDGRLASVLTRVLRIDPSDSTAREMLALEQARMGNCDAAVADFSLVPDQTNRHTESVERYASCLFQQRDYTRASAEFQQLLVREPENADARYDLALAQRRAGQNREAAETLKPLLATADYETLLLASDVSEDIGDTPDAVVLMRRAILLNPMRADPYVRFAELCLLHDSYDSGIAMVTAGIERLPNQSSLYLARGMLYGGLAKYDKAEADFRRAEQLDPHHGTGAYGVGLVEAQGNHSAEALATARIGLVANPRDAQLNYLLARILIDNGAVPGSPDFREAVHAATDAVRFNPNLLAAHDLMAKIDGMDGKTAALITQCKEALRIDPTDQNAMYQLMRAARKTGDHSTEQALVQQLEALHQHEREDESQRLRYKITVDSAPVASKGALR